MGAYTLTLSELCSILGITTKIENGITIIDKPEVFHLDSYPIHDESHRDTLNGLIFDTYWNREIAYETEEIFIQQFRRRMMLAAPNMNQLYKSAGIEYDVLSTMDMRTTSRNTSENVSERDGETTTTSESKSKSRALNSQTPQQSLDPDTGLYLDNGSFGFSDSEGDTIASEGVKGKDTADAEADSRTVGYAGNPAMLIQAFRETILNVDQMWIDELEPCFLQLWGTPHRPL